MRAGFNIESSESLRIGGGPRNNNAHLGHRFGGLVMIMMLTHHGGYQV